MGREEKAGAFFLEAGEYGCLLMHGFTGTSAEMRPLGEALWKAGYTVSAPLLPGHGRSMEALMHTGWRDWLGEARKGYAALRERCEKVCVMGLSMGGLLALLLAEEFPVDALVCMSPPMKLKNCLSALAPVGALVHPNVRWVELEGPPAARVMEEYLLGYDGFPLKRVTDLRLLMARARRGLFSVVADTLVIQPERDETVRPQSARIILDGISSRRKRLISLKQSGHMCTIGPEHQEMESQIIAFLAAADEKALAL